LPSLPNLTIGLCVCQALNKKSVKKKALLSVQDEDMLNICPKAFVFGYKNILISHILRLIQAGIFYGKLNPQNKSGD